MLLSTSAADFLARISAKVVDGTVILMAVLGSLSYSFPNNKAIIATVFVTLLAVALAHGYGTLLWLALGLYALAAALLLVFRPRR